MRVHKSIFAGTALVVIAATGATAAEFCVTCEGPVASYACSFSEPGAADGDARLKLYCITELAKSGPHASCSVDRTKRPPCGGAVKTFAMPDGMPSPPAAASPQPAQQSSSPVAKQMPPPDAPKSDAPPKTVKEMVEKGNASTSKALEKTGETAVDAAKSTGNAIGNAGKAIGNAAKKTWNCITSLFGDC